MKTFNSLREQSLEEKLKASDPTGKWVSDFVHSDNPKFAGKSKKERIRMALGASYAAKGQNEETELDEEQLDELKTSTLLRYSTKANKALVGGDRSKEPKRIQGIQKAVSKIKDRYTVKEEDVNLDEGLPGSLSKSDYMAGSSGSRPVSGQIASKDKVVKTFHASKEAEAKAFAAKHGHTVKKLKYPKGHTNKEPHEFQVVKEDSVNVDESAWGKDKMANLKAAHDRHSEKAIAANKAGDDSATKLHQSKMNMIKTQMNKLRKESVEQVDEAFKMPPESLADKMARRHAEQRKKRGAPHPDYYKELGKSYDIENDSERHAKQAEIKKKYKVESVQLEESIKDHIEQTLAAKDINSKVEGNKVHVHPDNTAKARSIVSKMGTGHTVHGTLKEEDVEEAVGYGKPKKAYTSYHMNQYGNDSDENAHKNDPPPSNPYHAAKRERILKALNTFGDEMKKKNPSLKEEILSEISKKMKGKDPCWDDYKMIGTKMKNGKQVPNCVPKK